jgi:hypothetical protein
MGVIIDDGIQKEIDQFEAKGAFSLADQFRKANEVSLESLAFMAFVPAKYQALVANSNASQAIREQHDEKAKREKQEEKDHAQRLAAYQQQIDANVLRLSINGADVDISQGDLRKVMQHRVEELEEQKKELLKNGGNPKELRRVDNLIDEYHPIIDDLQNHKADAATMNAIKEVTKEDPPLAERIQSHYSDGLHVTASAVTERQTSLTAEDFASDTSAKSTLKTSFALHASPDIPPPAAAPPTLDKSLRKVDNTVQSLGL